MIKTLTTIATCMICNAASAATCSSAGDRIFGSGLELYALNISNYLSWCTVSVNGGAASTASTVMDSFPDYPEIPLYNAPAELSKEKTDALNDPKAALLQEIDGFPKSR